jgi:hypothetical protein
MEDALVSKHELNHQISSLGREHAA